MGKTPIQNAMCVVNEALALGKLADQVEMVAVDLDSDDDDTVLDAVREILRVTGEADKTVRLR